MDKKIIDILKDRFKNNVFTAGEEAYAKASTMVARTIKPGAVVRPAHAAEVAEIIQFVKEHKLPFAIRSGGHNFIATRLADGILLIDLSLLSLVHVVDEDKGIVEVGSGALWYNVASELERYGLAISSGDTRSVGVGGLATGGGLGWMLRKYGATVDCTIAAEVVTADGEIIHASEESHPDLFWAIRGGSSNFGIVTKFTFEAHHVDGVIAGSITYPLENVGQVIRGWRDAMREAPAELTTMFLVMPGFGDAPASLIVNGCFAGTDQAAADRAYAPFLTLGTPTSQTIAPKPYKDVLEEAGHPPNMRIFGNDIFMKEFSDEAIATIEEICQGTPPIIQIRHIAGKMNEYPADHTAFSHRDSEVLIVSPAFVKPDASDNDIAKALAPWNKIAAFGEGVYLNLLTEDTGKEITAAYLPATLQRLRTIKTKYDPANLFKTNYNIPPAE